MGPSDGGALGALNVVELGKELVGTPVVTLPEPGSATPEGELQEMEVKRLDKRGK